MPVDTELVGWADLIFTMENRHRRALQSRFRDALRDTPVVNLAIPDRYRFMDPALVVLLKERVTPRLR